MTLEFNIKKNPPFRRVEIILFVTYNDFKT